MKRNRWWWLCIVIVCAGVSGVVSAHAELVRSSPAANERLTASPTTIVLFFDEELDAQASSFQLLDAQAHSVVGVAGRVDLTDPDHARLVAENVPPLTEGLYQIQWQTLSTDGDGALTSGAFEFAIGTTAQFTALTPTLTATPTLSATAPSNPIEVSNVSASTSNGFSFWIVGGVAIMLGLMGVGLWWSRRQ